MDELKEASVALSWPDIGRLEWNSNLGSTTRCAMNGELSCSIVERQKNLADINVSYLLGGSAERHCLTSQHRLMQAFPDHVESKHNIEHDHYHSEDALWAACLKHELGLENAGLSPSDLIHTLPKGLQEAAHDMFQNFSRGASKVPRLDRSSPSMHSSACGELNCQETTCSYKSFVEPQSLTHRGGVFPSSFPGLLRTRSSHLPEGALPEVYFGNEPWINEAQNSPSTRRFQQPEQGQQRQICSTAQSSLTQTSGAAILASGARPRVRARRGQATDPHSIAERKRREKISNATKELQELVPTLSKADRIAFVEDVIEYVRFLQLQTKVFIMSRLGSTSAIAPLVAETSLQGQGGLEAESTAFQDYNMAAIEEEAAKLMEEDMSAALRFLHGKGMCLVPISLAAAMSSKDAKESN